MAQGNSISRSADRRHRAQRVSRSCGRLCRWNLSRYRQGAIRSLRAASSMWRFLRRFIKWLRTARQRVRR